MTANSVTQAVLYAMTTITSVAALGIALFGSAAFLERWLDGTDRGSTARDLDRRQAPAQTASDGK